MLTRFIFIYGPPAAGKTVCGKRLAESLESPFYDLDAEIELSAGRTIPEIFAEEGEAGFRQRETDMLQQILRRPAAVIALGGGALIQPENRQSAEANGQVVCLSASAETILERLEAENGGRPLLDGDQQINLKQLLARRAVHYASFSIQVNTDNASVSEVVRQIQIQLGQFRIKNMSPGCDVRFEENGISALGQLIQRYSSNAPLVLVSDENVAQYHLSAVLDLLQQSGISAKPIILPPGEEQKTFQTVQQLLERFASSRLDRSSTVIALGGGVVSDLTGFAAAIFMRGIRWIILPTSLLAMVDASLGGKTGVDLPEGKNLAGAFYPPQLVLIDPNFLSTLPEIELRNGLAEVVKHAMLADPELFERCRSGWSAVTSNLPWIVRRAMAVKLKIIEEDPYEHGCRAALNLGHTLGHALELSTDFHLKHGEAVAIGMVAAARLSRQIGLAKDGLSAEIETCFEGIGLPTSIPQGVDRQRLLSAMSLDKKRHSGRPRVVLPIAIGEVCWNFEIDDYSQLIDVMG